MILIDDVRIATAATRRLSDPAAVAVENGCITAILHRDDERLAARAGAAEIVAGDGRILMPGLVNAHTHSYGNVLRGTENSLPLEPWALYTVAYGRSLDDEAIRLSILIGAAEMIRNGITACVDHFAHFARASAALAAHRESGVCHVVDGADDKTERPSMIRLWHERHRATRRTPRHARCGVSSLLSGTGRR